MECILLDKEHVSHTEVGMIHVLKVMKLVSIFFAASIYLIGCGEPNLDKPEARERILDQAVDLRTLNIRGSTSGEVLLYAPNHNKPYTGWVKGDGVSMQDWSVAGALVQFQKGKAHGLYITWYSDGQIKEKGRANNGKKQGPWIKWHENGQMYEKGTYKNDKKYGLWIQWDKDGEETSRETY